MSENETLKRIRDDIPNYLSGKRLSHTLSVMEEAEKLGKLYGLSENDIARLRLAGLLHDITKEKSPDQQLELCRRFGYKYTEDDVNSPKVFHSITGAYLAREKYKEAVDDAVFNAIRYHTTGRPAMTIYEKLIYLADYIEPTRTFDDCIRLRKLFYRTNEYTNAHLDNILLISYDMTLSSLISEGQYIHPATTAARNYLIVSEKINQS